MTEPLREIPFPVTGGGDLASIDVFRYSGSYVVLGHQFGFWRINAFTGQTIQRVGIGYPNPGHPPSDIGVSLVGHWNHSVTTLAVTDEFIVTDAIAGIEGPDAAAVAWKNNENVDFHGFVPSAAGRWWNQSESAIFNGDLLYTPNDRGSYDVMNVRELRWIGANVQPPADTSPQSVAGYTYNVRSAGLRAYVLRRSDVAVSEPPAPPAPAPTPPAPLTPPIEEVPTMPPTTEVPPCPPGQARNFMGKCVPIEDTIPTPSPVTPHILILHDRHKIEGFFEPPGSAALKLMPVALNEDNCLMWALSPNNYECWVKVVKSDAGYAVGVTALTNVKYEVTVTDQVTGKQQTFTNKQGNLVGDFRWNGLPV